MVFVGVLFVMVIYVCQDCHLLSFIFLRNFARSFLNPTKFSVVGFFLLNALWLSFMAAQHSSFHQGLFLFFVFVVFIEPEDAAILIIVSNKSISLLILFGLISRFETS